MILHTSLAGMRRLSIPRDTEAVIPGHDTQKINAAYALGGRSLMIETVEGYIGNDLKINHLMEIDFKGFPKFIDSIGGVTVTAKRRVCSPPFDNFWKGLQVQEGRERPRRGEGARLGARPQEQVRSRRDDIDRAARQQQLLSGVRGQLDLARDALPRAAGWPGARRKAFKTDLHGPGLLALGLDAAIGGTGDSEVLKPSCLDCGAGGSLLVSEGRARATPSSWLKNGD